MPVNATLNSTGKKELYNSLGVPDLPEIRIFPMLVPFVTGRTAKFDLSPFCRVARTGIIDEVISGIRFYKRRFPTGYAIEVAVKSKMRILHSFLPCEEKQS